MIEVKYF